MHILDCTLRDGGYYTNWDFSPEVVDAYISAMNKLPVDYLELGYRNNRSKEYLGKFGYTPVSLLCHIRENCTKKLAVMLNEKSTCVDDLHNLLAHIVGLADMVRIAIDPKNFDRAVILAKAVKEMGFEVGFNCMYMSKWSTEYPGFLSRLRVLDDFCDLFCMVDSFGGVTPEDVKDIYCEVTANTSIPIGFHGHNNLELGLINTVTAIRHGCEYVDATIMGMGRGAGNLNMELLLTYLNAHDGLDVDFNVLGDVVSVFKPLMEKYQWGTNLPYMIAGANRIPQKEVMDWVTNRVYSFNSIVRALENKKNNTIDNAKFPHLNEKNLYGQVLIIGGGNSVREHLDAVKEYIRMQEDIALIFATSRNADAFLDVNVPKYYCLVGNESRRLTKTVGKDKFKGKCILPPYPRTMGTEVPSYAENNTFELSGIDFIDEIKDSVTTIAIQLAIQLTDGNILTTGYDGYPGNILSEKEMALTHENKIIFQAYKEVRQESLKSLTPSLYKDIEVVSVYQFI